MRRRAILGIPLLFAVAACSSGSGATNEPAPTPQPSPTVAVTVSDAVPSLERLEGMGLSPDQAKCFTETIDPEGTGRVQSAELFMEAFSTCT